VLAANAAGTNGPKKLAGINKDKMITVDNSFQAKVFRVFMGRTPLRRFKLLKI